MRIRVWDKELKLYWKVLAVRFDYHDKPVRFLGYRYIDEKEVKIDIEFSDNFELRFEE